MRPPSERLDYSIQDNRVAVMPWTLADMVAHCVKLGGPLVKSGSNPDE